eukprot:TRINITY_DN56421_c0_g1_i1.p1 TRINITY_DN56421_c0_g1~~TRINITY_DN56421_c0_g1_i1.p1  ORF type:complete len:139 (-),score=11.62 TRINITY_DN56421_c0_g1_i1:21-437(-)
MDNAGDECQATTPYCRVQKHRYVGCAIVTVASRAIRSAVINQCSLNARDQPVISLGDVQATVAVHVDKAIGVEVPQAIFAGWGSSIEKRTPVAADLIAEIFSNVVETILLQSPLSSFAPETEEIPVSRFNRIDIRVYQ